MKRKEFNEFLTSTRNERDVILLNKGKEYTQDDIDVLDNFKRNAKTKRRKVHQAMKAKFIDLAEKCKEGKDFINALANDDIDCIIEEMNPMTPLLIWSVYFDKHYDAISSYIYAGDVKSEERIETRFFDGNNYLELGAALAFEKEQKRNKVVDVINNKDLTEEAVKEKLEELKKEVEDVKFAGVDKIADIMKDKTMEANYSTGVPVQELKPDLNTNKSTTITGVHECKALMTILKGVEIVVTCKDEEASRGLAGILIGMSEDTAKTYMIELMKDGREVNRYYLDFSNDTYYNVSWKS